MSFKDVIKNSVYESLGGGTNLSARSILLLIAIAALVGLYIFAVYKLSSKSAFYSKDLNVTMAGMPIIVAAIMIAMQSNLLVSLGMVGALSIVRFRNAVKNPIDLLYLFWSISAGIIVGDPRQMIGHGIPVIRGGNQRQAKNRRAKEKQNAIAGRFFKHLLPAYKPFPYDRLEGKTGSLPLQRQQKQKQDVQQPPCHRQIPKTHGMQNRQPLRQRKKKKHPQTTGLNIRTKACVFYAFSLFINMNIAKQRRHRKQHMGFLPLSPALSVMGDAVDLRHALHLGKGLQKLFFLRRFDLDD